jgi:polyhydroxyalkanoate synthesis regulator phasin
MKDERMMILQMVSDGKISTDDGVKLLKALNKSADTEEKVAKAAKQFKDKVSDIAKDAEPKVKKVAHNLKVKSGEVADEIGERIKARMNKDKDTCDCEGDIIEAEDVDFSFDYTDEADTEKNDESETDED